MIVIGRDGQRRKVPDDYVLADGEAVYVPRYLMDHGTDRAAPRHAATTEPRYAWDGNSPLQLHRPGPRPKTLLQPGATTDDIEAIEAVDALNAARDALHEKRARQAAEIKEMFQELMYPRRM
jgi:hypothetical protein